MRFYFYFFILLCKFVIFDQNVTHIFVMLISNFTLLIYIYINTFVDIVH